jgi:two-component system, LytTR family, sensor histidine kinase AlgZ
MAIRKLLSQNKNLWVHLSFWCVYLSFNFYQISVFQRRIDGFEWSKGVIMIGTQFVLTMLIAYINYFFLLPRFLERKRWLAYILEFLVPFALIVGIRVIAQRYIVDNYSHHEKYFYSPTFIIQTVVITLFITIFISLLRFVSDWFELEAIKKEVQNEKLTAELNFLKAQINPHFLFNTLNNLYYLAYSKSENTTEVISKLSQVMRYMIYDANHERVLLDKEIEYMQNYISLERLRLNNQIPIDLSINGNTSGVTIAPLILITFLENAFKHGVTNTNPQAWVNIIIEVNGKTLRYSVENSKGKNALEDNGGRSGIGLNNVRRRLELMYPAKHVMKVDDTPDRYYIKLEITL